MAVLVPVPKAWLPLQVIAELLRYLKRSYWPFAWDSSAGAGTSTGERFHGLRLPWEVFNQ